MSCTQTSVEFLRIKSQSGGDAPHTHRQPGQSSQGAELNDKAASSWGLGNGSSDSHSSAEGSGSDSETDSVLHKLQAELEQERKNSQRIYAELVEEMEKHQHVLSLLEKEKKTREEEQKEKEVQLQDLQSQCLDMQQYKEEKEQLNKEVLELKKRLQEEEDMKTRCSDEVASSAIRLQSFEEERRKQEEEMRRLKDEVEKVRQVLEEQEKELKFREEGLKASKNRQNQAKVGFSCEDGSNEANLESGRERDSLCGSIPGDVMMERYLSSAPLAHSQSSVVNDSFERHSQLDISADYRLENCKIFVVGCVL